MKRMVNMAVLVAVLAVVVMAPATSYAAPRGSQMVSVESKGTAGMFQMLLSLIGFNPVLEKKSAPVQTAPTAGTVSTPGFSTETAIWGGRN